MVRVPPENVKLIAYKETVQAFGSAQAEPGQRIAFAFIVFRQPVLWRLVGALVDVLPVLKHRDSNTCCYRVEVSHVMAEASFPR